MGKLRARLTAVPDIQAWRPNFAREDNRSGRAGALRVVGYAGLPPELESERSVLPGASGAKADLVVEAAALCSSMRLASCRWT